jgi:hypothetical protein
VIEIPFKSAKQEIWMQINHPDIYKRWKKIYGNAPGYKRRLKQNAKRRKKRQSVRQKKR